MSLEDREHILNQYKHLFMPVDTNIDINDVMLSDENKLKIKEFLREYGAREELAKYGLKPMNRILMYGDSGTGKTFLTKALSNYMKYTMLYVDIAKSLSEDTVAQNISDIFVCANALKNCIIFFDECDSIAWNRDAKTAEGGTVRRAVNSLFQQLDQIDPSNIFVSATNMLKRLDPAFERRFDLKLEFRKPKTDLAENIKKFMFDGFTLVNDVSKSELDLMTRRVILSYYEIQIITERNMKKAILNHNEKVNGKVVVKLSSVLNDLAVHLQMKTKFGTDKESIDTFTSNLATYKFE